MNPWKRKEVIGDATLYLGDCLEILPTLRKVDAVITSPPYAQQRDYGAKITDWDALMCGAFDGLQAADACQVLVNLGQIHRDGEVICYWEPWRDWMKSQSWRFFGQYVWDQGDGLPGNWNGRLAPSHEYVFHFNRIAKPANKWVRVANPRKASGTGLRSADGTTKGISSPDKCGQPFKIADSVIRVYREMRREFEHPAIYPVRLPQEIASSFTDLGHTVSDPFMGSGTTGVACMNLGRSFIGIEIEPKYFDIACQRIENAQRQQKMFPGDDYDKVRAEQGALGL